MVDARFNDTHGNANWFDNREPQKQEVQQCAHNFVWVMKDGNKTPSMLFTQSKNAMEITNITKMRNKYFHS